MRDSLTAGFKEPGPSTRVWGCCSFETELCVSVSAGAVCASASSWCFAELSSFEAAASVLV